MAPVNSLIPLDGKIYAPLYFATLLSTGLYGVTCMQTFYYYVHYPSDSLRMKALVAVLWALDTIHEALTIAGSYKYIIAGLENPLSILVQNPELALQILSETMVSAPVQAFFVYRIYLSSGKNIVAPLLWVIQVICQLTVATIYVAKALYCVNGQLTVIGSEMLDDSFFTGLVTSSLSVSAAVDVLIAIAMTYFLLRMRSETGFTNTAHVLQRLIVFAVNTGAWTAFFAVLSLILLRVYPSTFLDGLPSIPLSSLYCNTLLANLNVRASMRDGEQTPLFDNAKAMKQNVATSPTHQQRNTQVVALVPAAASSKSGSDDSVYDIA